MLDDIKDYREKELRNFVIANLIIIILITDTVDKLFVSKEISNYLSIINLALVLSFIYIVVFIIDGLIPAIVKDRLLYFKRYQLPGYSVFSKIQKNKIKDMRYFVDDFLKVYKELYVELNNYKDGSLKKKKKENQEWYSIYNKYRENKMILVSQRDYLLARDMYIAEISLLLIYILMAKLFGIIDFNKILVFYFCISIVILNLLTRVKIKRFVSNVVVVHMFENRKEGSLE